MTPLLRGSSSDRTRHFEWTVGQPAEEVYPCRCGEVHRGPYAAYDYGHHNCFHDAPLDAMDPFVAGGELQAMCPMCGEVFDVEEDQADAA